MITWASQPAWPPWLTDAELLTRVVAQALLGIRSEARWLRLLPLHLPGAFRYLPQRSGYNKRLRAAVPLLKRIIRMLATVTDLWTDATPGWSTPPQWSAPDPARPRSGPSSRDGPATDIAQAIHGSSGVCDCT
jgi:hypothetical protein